MPGPLPLARIISTGSYVPAQSLTNAELAQRVETSDDWIVERTGIHERRIAADGELASDLAVEASRRAIAAAGLTPDDLGMIVVATISADQPLPSCAVHVQRKLGARCPAFDVAAACAGFIYGLELACRFVATGTRPILVVGVELLSRLLDWSDRETCVIFGDGAGAVLLGAGQEEQGLISYSLGSEGDFGALLSVPAGGSREPVTAEALRRGRHYMRMDGRAVFKWAVRMVSDVGSDVVRHAGITMDDIDLVVMHQANLRIIDAAVEGLGVDRQRVLVNLDRFGNTTAASVPLVLDEAVTTGRLTRGDHVLLMGFGAGLTWGAGVLRY